MLFKISIFDLYLNLLIVIGLASKLYFERSLKPYEAIYCSSSFEVFPYIHILLRNYFVCHISLLTKYTMKTK